MFYFFLGFLALKQILDMHCRLMGPCNSSASLPSARGGRCWKRGDLPASKGLVFVVAWFQRQKQIEHQSAKYGNIMKYQDVEPVEPIATRFRFSRVAFLHDVDMPKELGGAMEPRLRPKAPRYLFGNKKPSYGPYGFCLFERLLLMFTFVTRIQGESYIFSVDRIVL